MLADPEMEADGDVSERLIRLAAACANDPLRFAKVAFPWGEPGELAAYAGPRRWQADLLGDIGAELQAQQQPGARRMPILRAVATGHGTGKSAFASMFITWAMSTAANTRIVITANTESQLRTKTWPEVSKFFSLGLMAHWFKVGATSITAADPERERSWRCDMIPWSENNTTAFAGLHNAGRRLCILFDEASGIHDSIWEVAEGALSDADTQIIWLALGNPTQPDGRFFRAFNAERDRWHGREIDARTVEGTNLALFEEQIRLYGINSDFVKVRILGQFPSVGSSTFIAQDLVDAAMARDIPTPLPSDGLVIGVDVARFGSDATVLAFRRGRDARSIPWQTLRSADTMQVAARVAEAALRYRADAIHVDGGGVGGGVVDRLRQMGFTVRDVNFGAKPDRAPITGVQDGAYANKRSEMWGHMREWLRYGAVPDDKTLRADLTGPNYSYVLREGRDVLMLERKRDMIARGLASPDWGDALALCLSHPVTRTQGRADLERDFLSWPSKPTQPVAAHDYNPFALT